MKLRLWFGCAKCDVRKGEKYEQRVRWFLLGCLQCATQDLPLECPLIRKFSNQNRVGKGEL